MNKQTEELMRAYMVLSQQIRPNRIVSDLSSNEALILALLVEEEGKTVTPSQIVKACGMLKSQVNKYTGALEERGLILRTHSEEDRRKVYLSLTEKGKQVYAGIHQESVSYVESIVETLGKEKSAQLTGLLQEALAAVLKQKENNNT